MEKSKLNRFISKYALNGNVESVVWKSDANTLTVKFVDDSRSVMGTAVCDNINFPTAEFGVNQTSKLKSLLGMMGDDINVDIKKKSDVATVLGITDENFNVSYVLSDINIIPTVPTLKSPLPKWNVVLDVDNKFIENFIKAANALNDVKEVGVSSSGDQAKFVLGSSNSYTTKVEISADVKMTADSTDMATTYFSTAHIKDILSANKECRVGKIEVTDKGLMRIHFNVDDFKTTYYLTARELTNG